MKKIKTTFNRKNVASYKSKNILSLIGMEIGSKDSEQGSDSQYYQSFIYTDHITNNIMSIENDMLHSKSDFRNCAHLLKQTRRFHVDSIKQKNYKFNRNTDNSYNSIKISMQKDEEDRGKEKILKHFQRKKKQKQIYINQKYNLNRLLQKDRNYQYSSCNASIHHSPTSTVNIDRESMGRKEQKEVTFFPEQSYICEEKIENKEDRKMFKSNKLLLALQQYDKQNCDKMDKLNRKTHYHRKKSSQISPEPVSASEKQLLQNLNFQIRHEIIKKSQFLIPPKSYKKVLLLKSLNKDENKPAQLKIHRKFSIRFHHPNILLNRLKDRNLHLNKIKHISQVKQEQPEIIPQKTDYGKLHDVSDYRFNEQVEEQIHGMLFPQPIKEQNLSMDCVMDQRIIMDIKKGNYFGVEIELSLHPDMKFIKQKNTNNNLLHLCILHNQADIFWMVLRKLEDKRQSMLTQQNKYSRTPFQLAKVYRIIKKSYTIQDILTDPRLKA